VKKKFTMEYWRDGEWYVGRLKGVPGVFSQGRSIKRLEENIREVYRLMVDEAEGIQEDVKRREISFLTM